MLDKTVWFRGDEFVPNFFAKKFPLGETKKVIFTRKNSKAYFVKLFWSEESDTLILFQNKFLILKLYPLAKKYAN